MRSKTWFSAPLWVLSLGSLALVLALPATATSRDTSLNPTASTEAVAGSMPRATVPSGAAGPPVSVLTPSSSSPAPTSTAAPGSPAAVQESPVSLHGPLVVSGGELIATGSGSPVELQGVDILKYGLGKLPGGMVDAGALRTLEDWRVNLVRLGISSDDYLQQCPGENYDPNYRSELTDAVDSLTAAGIEVVIDIHSSNPNCMFPQPETSQVAALPGPDVASALASLAKTFGANPLVAFEPFNEPEACAQSTSGPGASQFFPSSATANGTCSNEQLASLAWNDPGTVTVQGTSVLGAYVGATSYQSVGMDDLYQVIMANIPKGAPAPLVFLDANYFASDPNTFDDLAGPLLSAPNLVEAFHPYDCQDTGSSTTAMCQNPAPESCSTTTEMVERDLVDPATGRPWARPVVFDEFNFPAGEDGYFVQLKDLAVPISVYQHGYWVNNMIASMQAGGAAGWAVSALTNADVQSGSDPYSIVQQGVTASTPTPWPVTVNDAPAVAAMGGRRLSCEDPPPGFG